jgi:zinc transporter ZupT
MYNKTLNFLKANFDKVLHFTAGMFIMLVVAIFFPAWVAFLAVCLAALLKEVRDEIVYSGFNWRDLVVTVAGGLLVWICLLVN